MTAIYAFGPFRLDVAAGILFRGAEPVALGQRAIALLQILVEGGGNPISNSLLKNPRHGESVVIQFSVTNRRRLACGAHL